MGAGAIGLVGGLVGTGAQMYGQIQAGKQAKEAAKYNENLAQIEATNRENETVEGIRRARISQREALAKMRVMATNSGLQTTAGLPMTLMGEAAGRMEIEVADAARKANMESAALRARGRMGVFEAKQFATGQKIGALGTAATGAANFYTKRQIGKYYGV